MPLDDDGFTLTLKVGDKEITSTCTLPATFENVTMAANAIAHTADPGYYDQIMTKRRQQLAEMSNPRN
jgi:hypothetical protein